jgi:PAS domain S-box-containing protein
MPSPAGGRVAFETGSPISPALAARWFQAVYETRLMFAGVLDGEGRLLDANRRCVEGCGLDRGETLGRLFWECGWWSPDPDVAERVRGWCCKAVTTGRPVRALSRYFLGNGTPRTVELALEPVRDDDGGVTYLVATGSDVTDAHAAQRAAEERLAVETEALRAVAAARGRELAAVQEAEQRAARRLHRLMGVALALVTVETVTELTETVVNRGLSVLGADGGGMVLRDGTGGLRVVLSRGLTGDALPADLPIDSPLQTDSPLPAAHVTRTGRRLVLPTRAAGLAFTPAMRRVYEITGRDAWAFVPLTAGERVLGALAVCWVEERDVTDDELGLIEAFAAQSAEVLERIRATRAEREGTRKLQRLATALQRGLMTRPLTADDLDVAVRYLPAASEAQIGGDWYDAFTTASGATLFCVGDVSGHDGDAAAAMGQLRGLLRGLAVDSDDSPAVLLTRLDRAIGRLGLDTLATALLARVDSPPAEAVQDDGGPVAARGRARGAAPGPAPGPAGGPARGSARRVRWSSAGHLPPLLRLPGGKVRILTHPADLLLGIDATTERAERELELPIGATMLLCTDGLVERRGEAIDASLGRLARAFAATDGASPAETCDSLLATMLPRAPEDDVAVLVLRAVRAQPVPSS